MDFLPKIAKYMAACCFFLVKEIHYTMLIINANSPVGAKVQRSFSVLHKTLPIEVGHCSERKPITTSICDHYSAEPGHNGIISNTSTAHVLKSVFILLMLTLQTHTFIKYNK